MAHQQMQTTGSLHQVFDLIECLEGIFSHLDARNLIKASTVSRSWRSTAREDRVWKTLLAKDFPELARRPIPQPVKAIDRYKSIATFAELEWHDDVVMEMDAATQLPSPRWGHTMHKFRDERIVMFGGEAWVPLNDTWVLHCDSKPFRWEPVKPTGSTPRPRFGHAAVLLQDATYVVFGGSVGGSYLNDVHTLDTTEWVWSQPPCTGTPPSPRSSHSLTPFGSARCLMVFGGIGNRELPNTGASVPLAVRMECYSDVFILDCDSWTWSVPNLAGSPPPKRFVHRAVELDGGAGLMIFGGRTEGHDKYNDVHILHANGQRWETVMSDGTRPCARGGHAFISVGKAGWIVFCGRKIQDECISDGVFWLRASLDDAGGVMGAGVGLTRTVHDGAMDVDGGVSRREPQSTGVAGAGANEDVLDQSALPSRSLSANWTLRFDVPGLAPSPRGAHGCCLTKWGIVVFGGYGHVAHTMHTNAVLGDTYLLEV